MARISAKQIGGLTLAVDPKKLDKTVVLAGKNFVMDLNGPKSGFGFTRFYLDLTENDFVESIELGNEVYYFAHNEDEEFCNVYKVDYATRQYVFQFTIPQINASQERKRHPWTVALVGGLYYVNHLSFGIYEYNVVTGDWYDRSSTIHTNLGDTDVYGITQSAGRAVYLTSANTHWSAIDDATDVTPSTITGAGFQSLALIGAPTKDYEYKGIYPVADGFLTFTQIGVMKSTIIDSINPFRHDPLTTDYIPFNQNCIVQLTKGTLVILTPIGLFSTDGKTFTPWQPLMSEYLKDVEIPTFSLNTIGQVQLHYDIRREWFFISISKTRNVNFFTRAFVLYVPISEWGSFDYSHRGFVTVDEFGDGSKLLPGFIDANGKLAVFTDSPANIDIAAREASGAGATGLDCGLDQVTRKETNGDFTSDISGWTDNSDAGGSIAWNASGYIDLIHTTGNAIADQTISTIIGRSYKLVADKIANSSQVKIGTTQGNIDLYDGINDANDIDATFIATTTTTHVRLTNISAGTTAQITSVSITEYCAPNLFSHPENFEHVSWLLLFLTVTPNSALSPDGTLSADKLVATTDVQVHQISKSPAWADNQEVNISINAKPDGYNFASIVVTLNDGAVHSAYFDLVNGLITTTTLPGKTFIEARVGGYYRLSIQTNSQAGAFTPLVRFRVNEVSGVASFAGNGVDGILVFGAQLTETVELQPYISEWELEKLPANEIFYPKSNLQNPTVSLNGIIRANSVWQMDSLNVSHEQLNNLGIEYPVLPGFYEMLGLQAVHADTPVTKYDMPDYFDAGTHHVIGDRITESKVEIAVFGYGKQVSVSSALNSEAEIGLFRLTDEKQTGQFTEINEAFIGMEDSTGEDFSNEDYLLDSAQDIFIDYLTEPDIEEDWGFSSVSGSEYTQYLIGTIDGNTVFENAILELEEAGQYGKTKHCVGSVSGMYLKLHIDATGIGQSFHLKELEFTGILAGRL